MKIVEVKLDAVKPYARNQKKHSEEDKVETDNH